MSVQYEGESSIKEGSSTLKTGSFSGGVVARRERVATPSAMQVGGDKERLVPPPRPAPLPSAGPARTGRIAKCVRLVRFLQRREQAFIIYTLYFL